MQLDDARSCRHSLSHGLWHRIKWDHVVGVGWTAGRTGVVHDVVDAHEGLRAYGASTRRGPPILSHTSVYVLRSGAKRVHSAGGIPDIVIQAILQQPDRGRGTTCTQDQ